MNIHRRHLDEFQRAGDWSVDKLARRISQERKEKTLFTSETSRCSDNTDQEVKVEEDERWHTHPSWGVCIWKEKENQVKTRQIRTTRCVNRSRPSRTKEKSWIERLVSPDFPTLHQVRVNPRVFGQWPSFLMLLLAITAFACFRLSFSVLTNLESLTGFM